MKFLETFFWIILQQRFLPDGFAGTELQGWSSPLQPRGRICWGAAVPSSPSPQHPSFPIQCPIYKFHTHFILLPTHWQSTARHQRSNLEYSIFFIPLILIAAPSLAFHREKYIIFILKLTVFHLNF